MPDQEQPKRTTDERIDAIAMNLELLGHEVAELGVKTSIAIEALATRMDQLAGVVERTDSNINRLAELATGIFQNHERRIAALETHNQ
jgi:hypothetical protein